MPIIQILTVNLRSGSFFLRLRITNSPFFPLHSGPLLQQPQAAAVASLGLVSPGAANWWCRPYFFLKKTGDLFSTQNSLNVRCHPYFSLQKLATFFSHHRVSPPVLPAVSHFPTSILQFLYKFAAIFFHSGVTPWMVSTGALRPLVTPRSCCAHTPDHGYSLTVSAVLFLL